MKAALASHMRDPAAGIGAAAGANVLPGVADGAAGALRHRVGYVELGIAGPREPAQGTATAAGAGTAGLRG